MAAIRADDASVLTGTRWGIVNSFNEKRYYIFNRVRFFRAQRGKTVHKEIGKYRAAVRPELDEGQAKNTAL